jgi:hypothetical protein
VVCGETVTPAAQTFLALTLETRRREPTIATVDPAIDEVLPRPATLFCLVIPTPLDEELAAGKVKFGASVTHFARSPILFLKYRCLA